MPSNHQRCCDEYALGDPRDRRERCRDTTAVINATNLGCSIACKDLEASIRFYRERRSALPSSQDVRERAGRRRRGDRRRGCSSRVGLDQDERQAAGQGHGLEGHRVAVCRSTWRALRTSTRRRRRITAAGGSLLERAGGPAVGRPDVPVQGSRTGSSSACPRRSRDRAAAAPPPSRPRGIGRGRGPP